MSQVPTEPKEERDGAPGAAAPPPDPKPQIAELEKRYGQPELLAETRAGCALARRNARMADSLWLRTLQQLDQLPLPAVLNALRLYTTRYADGDKAEAYLVGIARRNAVDGRLGRLAGMPGVHRIEPPKIVVTEDPRAMLRRVTAEKAAARALRAAGG